MITRTEYGLRLDWGSDAGEVLPIEDRRAERLPRPTTVNGKPATLMARYVRVSDWFEVEPSCVCGPDHTGEDIDIRPDCPRHGDNWQGCDRSCAPGVHDEDEEPF